MGGRRGPLTPAAIMDGHGRCSGVPGVSHWISERDRESRTHLARVDLPLPEAPRISTRTRSPLATLERTETAEGGRWDSTLTRASKAVEPQQPACCHTSLITSGST